MRLQLLDKNTVGIFFEYNPKTVQVVKSCPGRTYEPRLRAWLLPVDGLLKHNLDTLSQAGFAVPEQVRELVPSGRNAPVLEPPNAQEFTTTLPLYPFQKEVASFMAKGSCLNACFVGAGKTLITLATCEHLQAKRTLIVVPKSVLLQWATVEISKWLPERKSIWAIQGNNTKRQLIYNGINSVNKDVPTYVVIGYETARSDIADLEKIKWDVVACDEAHRLANPRTQTYKALSRLQADYRFAMTATPVMNAPQDMYGIINWVRPGSLGNYYGFLNRYLVKGGYMNKQVVGNKNMQELARRVAPYIIRKTLEEVGLQLPAKQEIEIPVQLSEKEELLYNNIKSELLFEIENSDISKIESPIGLQNTLTKIGKLFELCDSLELIGDNKESSKLDALKEHLEGTIINGQKAIIVTRFERMAKILERELGSSRPLLITGQTGDRQKILNDFQNIPEHKLLIGTEAIGQGLNLQVANILYNYDLPWNPAKLEQRIGRIHRQGQEKPVFIYNLVCTKGVEQWLKRKIEQKKQLSATLLPKSVAEIKEMLE